MLFSCITDCLNDERDNLLALAEELAKIPSELGGPQNYPDLFPILEQMCTFEDTTVREKAIQVFAQLFPVIPKQLFQTKALEVIQKLSDLDSSHANASACSLTAVALACSEKADRVKLIDYFKTFITGSKDNILPFVHETAARTLSVCVIHMTLHFFPFLQYLFQNATADEIEQYFYPYLQSVSKDEQDSVRQAACDAFIAFVYATTFHKIHFIFTSHSI